MQKYTPKSVFTGLRGDELCCFEFYRTAIIKYWFTRRTNKSGCRYVVVDAYNTSSVLSFYEKNEFKYLYTTEEEERETFGLAEGEHLNSRMMYFDLIGYSE